MSRSSFGYEYGWTSGGMAWNGRWKALSRARSPNCRKRNQTEACIDHFDEICVFFYRTFKIPKWWSLSTIKSAAELDGVATKIRECCERVKSCASASITVTVFPVPWQNCWDKNKKHDHAPKITIPGGPKIMYGNGLASPFKTFWTAYRCCSLRLWLNHLISISAKIVFKL